MMVPLMPTANSCKSSSHVHPADSSSLRTFSTLEELERQCIGDGDDGVKTRLYHADNSSNKDCSHIYSHDNRNHWSDDCKRTSSDNAAIALGSTLRVRVINQHSKRQKDLVIDVSTTSLFDAVYDHPAVKKAHVRKWGPYVVQMLKASSSSSNKSSSMTENSIRAEIKCAVWDDMIDLPIHTFSIDDLRKTSTLQLHRLVPESNLVKLVLMFVEKMDIDEHENVRGVSKKSDAVVAGANGSERDTAKGQDWHNQLPACSSSPLSAGTSRKINTHHQMPGSLFSPHTLAHSPSSPRESGIFRCPFSGVVVQESFRCDIEAHVQEQRSMARGIGRSISASTAHSSDPRSMHTLDSGNTTDSDEDASDYHSCQEQVVVHNVAAVDDMEKKRCNKIPPICTFEEEEEKSVLSTSDHLLQELGSLQRRSTMRIRISSDPSKRFKDLIVAIANELNVFDVVYNNPDVQSALVREWTTDVVNDAKNNVAEIRCLGTGVDGCVSRTFSLEELKMISTLDLFELAPESDPLHLVLQCVGKTSLVHRVRNGVNVDTMTQSSMRHEIETSKAKAPTLAISNSEPSFQWSGKRSLRPNHMNLSARKNATFGSANLEPRRRASYTYGAMVNLHQCVLEKGQPTTECAVNGYEPVIAQVTTVSFDPAIMGGQASHNRASIGPNNFPVLECRPPSIRQSSAPSATLPPLSGTMSGAAASPMSPFVRAVANHGDSDNIDLSSNDIQTAIPFENVAIASPLNGDLAVGLSRKEESDRKSSAKGKPMKDFCRLCRSKKAREQPSGNDLRDHTCTSSTKAMNGFSKANFMSLSPCESEKGPRASAALVSSRDPHRSRPVSALASSSFAPARKGDDFGNKTVDKFEGSGLYKKSSTSKIDRFLEFSQRNSEMREITDRTNLASCNENEPSQTQSFFEPPFSKTAVITDNALLPLPPPPLSGISLSGDVVKEVFPYHIVVDESFTILQVGNNISLLIDEGCLLGRKISDVLAITGPIPLLDKWEWDTLDMMRDKTLFLESILPNASGERAGIKGTIIEVSAEPRQVMLALFPNVKNLAELDKMNLSMADLPLHSCQREAVLLGEHSKSEVKLTNHLDQLHRDLINSMEKQIEDRTNELALANKDLESANARLEVQSARQLEHFACMSHEIRTPLNCIVGMSSLLLEDIKESTIDPMHADSIQMINTSGELLKAVVDDVLDYAKLESGSFEVDIKPTKLQNALDSVVHSIAQKIEEKNICLRTLYSPLLPEMIETDSRRLQQVLFNLLGNAGKFSKNNSVIDLRVSLVEVAPHDRKKGPGVSQSRKIRFSVKDYGKGIHQKDFERIFQPFSQASKETQNVYGGTGLGLSITSRLVNRLGGTICVHSELEKFSEFTVDLPMNGKPVDVEGVKNRMKNTTIVLVEPERKYNFPSTTFRVGEKSLVLGTDAAKLFGLKIVRCRDLEEAHVKLSVSDKSGSQDHFALLIHEDSYVPKSFHKLHAMLGKQKYTLMTHGPNYLVDRTKDRHFKSLSGVFTETLLNSIADHVRDNTTTKNSISPSEKSSFVSDPTPYPAGPSFATNKEGAVGRNGASGGGGLFAALNPTLEKGCLKSSVSGNEGEGLVGTTTASQKTNRNRRSLFPAVTATSTSEQPMTPKDEIEKLGLKVLYAEDNIVNQKVLARVLDRSGVHNITVVDNGKKAVDISASTKFDVIFLDMQMPVMDGMEACQLIMERDPNAKIVFVTAHALDEFKSKAKAVGATSFITKPFRVIDIQEVVKKIGKLEEKLSEENNEVG